MKRVYIAVINDLVSDQRVRKVARLLVDNGLEVCCLGRELPASPPFEGEGYRVRRFRMLFKRGPLFYAFFNIRLFLKLMVLPRPSLLISNDLDTLPATYMVARFRRVKLIYDSHEFFTEVPELIHRKKVQGIWLWIENRLLPRLEHAITVSPSIADHYQSKYGTWFKVVRNLPERLGPEIVDKLKSQSQSQGNRSVIYQGALNVGRGLELMILSMRELQDLELLLAGSGDIEEDLKELVKREGLEDRVRFLGRIDPGQLAELTCSAGLGLSLEEDLGLNYRYALPNKLFDYIQCRIPVICADLPEMAALVSSCGAGEILKDRNPSVLAALVRDVLKQTGEGAWDDALEQAAELLCWEKEKGQYKEVLRDCGTID